MTGNILTIASSGLRAARAAMDVTSQNIANANTTGYVRRSVNQADLTSVSGGINGSNEAVMSGVRVQQIVRNADPFLESEVRRTGSDTARATAQVAGLTQLEDSIGNSGLYDQLVKFEGAMSALAVDPTNTSLRTSLLQTATNVASTFNVAASSLAASVQGIQNTASQTVDQINQDAAALAQVNVKLAQNANSTEDLSSLEDQRDNLLKDISQYADVTVTMNSDKTASVMLGGSGGVNLVGSITAGVGSTAVMTMATAPDGTISFALGGTPITVTGGSLAGNAQALSTAAGMKTTLDGIAGNLITMANTAQANGVDLNGTPGQPMFSGTGAGDIALALTDGTQIATAPAGAVADSRDAGNLTALQAAYAANSPTQAADTLLYNISALVAGATTTQSALQTISDAAENNLTTQSGVDLDQEATNLVRYQQAFQASSKAIQTAVDCFNSIYSVG